MRAIVCILAMGLAGRDPGPPASNASAESMMGFLEEHDISAFMEEAKRAGWQSPIIYSKWYVDRMEEGKSKDEAGAARELGRLLARSVSEVAEELIPSTERDEWVRMSEELLSLAAWIGGTEGYGNLFLGARCHDVACVGVARLVVDLGFPFERIKPMMASFDAAWYGPEVRARVLNAEAGVELFKVKGLSMENAEEVLEETWRTGRISLRKQEGAWTQTLPIQLPVGPIWENAAFFEEDRDVCRPCTTESTWDKRRHRMVALGVGSVNVRNLRPLTVFREKVGAFPLERRSKGYYPGEPGMAAFEGAWRPYETRETIHIPGPAWGTFDAVRSGTFIDEDTWNVRAFERGRATLTSSPMPTRTGSKVDIQ